MKRKFKDVYPQFVCDQCSPSLENNAVVHPETPVTRPVGCQTKFVGATFPTLFDHRFSLCSTQTRRNMIVESYFIHRRLLPSTTFFSIWSTFTVSARLTRGEAGVGEVYLTFFMLSVVPERYSSHFDWKNDLVQRAGSTSIRDHCNHDLCFVAVLISVELDIGCLLPCRKKRKKMVLVILRTHGVSCPKYNNLSSTQIQAS